RERSASQQHRDDPLSPSKGSGHFHAMVIGVLLDKPFFEFLQPRRADQHQRDLRGGQLRFEHYVELVSRRNTHDISEHKATAKLVFQNVRETSGFSPGIASSIAQEYCRHRCDVLTRVSLLAFPT